MNCSSILIVATATTAYILDDCISLRFEKERYTPFTLLEGQWYAKDLEPSEITFVGFSMNGKELHSGYPCGAEIIDRDGKRILKLRSRGYTEALSRNQPKAGLVSSVTLETLANSAIICPSVTYEANTPTVNYVNYYDGTSIWDAVVCYSLRATGLYPYIRDTNTVRVSRPINMSQLYLMSSQILQKGTGNDYSNLISGISMADVFGEPGTFNITDTETLSKNIVRQREIVFDQEWIMDPEAGLQARINHSKRAMRYDWFALKGFNNVDLLDQIVIADLGYVGEISRIVITASQEQPVTTKLYCYHDAYCA